MKINHRIYVSAIVAAVIFAACSSPFQTGENNQGRTGNVTIQILTGEEERTILPDQPFFSYFEFEFTPKGGQIGHEPISVEDGSTQSISVTLAEGNWAVTVRGYVYISGIAGIDDGHYLAATGSESISISEGIVQYVFIELRGGIQPGEQGIFSYTARIPDGVTEAALRIKTIQGTLVREIDLLAMPNDTVVFESGYYLTVIQLTDAYGESVKTEVIHIYGGMTTTANWKLYHSNVAAFSSLEALSRYLYLMPENTKDNPHPIALYDFNLETDFAYYSFNFHDSFYRLFDILRYDNKYVSIDLSDCYGEKLGGSFSMWSDGRNSGCLKLVSITLPEGIVSLDDGQFVSCSNLTSITLPNSLAHIGKNTFWYCTSLTSITLPDSLAYIGIAAFGNCSSLASIVLPDSITSIEYMTFTNCSSLSSVTLPDSLAFVDDYAFAECESIEFHATGNGIFSVYDNMLIENGTKLVAAPSVSGDVIVPEGITTIGFYAFAYNKFITSIILPNSLTYIDGFAFYLCTSLSSAALSDSLVNIGDSAFWGAPLNLLELPDSLLYIGAGAFTGVSLDTLTLPDSLAYIGYEAFWGASLNSITLPDSLEFIGDGAFRGCDSVTFLATGNGKFTVYDNMLIENGIKLVAAPSASGDIVIPDGITEIYGRVFIDKTLTSVALPVSLESIGAYAFYATSLSSIILPNSLTYIGESAFAGCMLSSVTLPGSLASIGFFAFGQNPNLTTVICYAVTPPSLDSGVFSWTDDNLIIKVPSPSVAAYKTASDWSEYASRIVAME